MKLVIDIPDNDYKSLVNPYQFNEYLCSRLKEIVRQGTPLPKGHGRLIDENKLKKEAIRCEWSRLAYDMLDHTLSYIKPIIDASSVEEVPLTVANGMTNGDMLKAMFPDVPVNVFEDMLTVMFGNAMIDLNWWNAPYKSSFSTAVTK